MALGEGLYKYAGYNTPAKTISKPQQTSNTDTGTGYNPATHTNIPESDQGQSRITDKKTTFPFLNTTPTNPLINALQNSKQQTPSVPINPKTETPYDVESKATPVLTYGDFTKQYGPVTGTINYLGTKLSGSIDQYQIKSGNYYQQEAFRNLGYAAPNAVFAVPVVGAPLYTISGAETVIKAPTLGGKAMGVLQTGVGAFGIKSDLASFSANAELKAFEATPTKVTGVRIESPNGALDILYGSKTTPYGSYITQIKQPVYNVGDNGFTLEGGQAISLGIKPSKVNVAMSTISGSGKVLDTTPRVGQLKLNAPYLDTQPTRISYDVPGYTSTTGKANINTVYSGTLKYNTDTALKFGDIESSATMSGTLKPTNIKTTKYFIGGAKETNGYINMFGATPEYLRIPKSTGTPITAVGAKGFTVGDVKVYKYNPPSDSFNLGGGGTGVRTILKPTSYAPSVVDQALKSTIKSPTTTFIPRATLISTAVPKSKLTQLSYVQFNVPTQSQRYSSLQSFAPTTTQQPRQIQINVPNVALDTRQTTTPIFFQPSGTAQTPRQTPKLNIPTPIINVPTTPKSTPIFTPPLIPLLPSGSLNWQSVSGKVFRGFRQLKYTPSYEALVFNIKGRMPKGVETGARIRPITKGFKWFNMPKLKLGKFK